MESKKIVMLTTGTAPVQGNRLHELLDRCRLVSDEASLDYSALTASEVEELWNLVAKLEN
jgi:hypothetical protein